MHAYRVAISMIAPPLTPHLFLPRIPIITNNYWNIPPRLGQALTIAVGHDRDCCVQFEYSCKQLCNVEKFFTINLSPKELKHNRQLLVVHDMEQASHKAEPGDYKHAVNDM